MADLSQIKLPNNSTYNLKDAKARDDFDNLKIGGRNLLLNSEVPIPTVEPYDNSTATLYNATPLDGINYYYCSGAKYWRIDFPALVVGETYSLWFDIARSSDSRAVFVKIGDIEENVGSAPARAWKRLGISFVASTATYAEIRIAYNSTSTNNDYIAALRNLKLEKGTKPTDWTPAPEDKADVTDVVLESPYTEVEWVESNGKQFVYLDWKPKIATWGFEADFIIRNTFNSTQAAWDPSVNANNAGCIFGTRNAGSTNDIEFLSYSANGMLRIGNGTNQTVAATFKKDKTRQTIKLIGTTLTNSDGTTKTVTRLSETANKPYSNMAVFAYHEGLRRMATGNLLYPSSTRIYSLKFYDSTTLECNLVGAIRKSDGVTGLYDKIAKHFYPAPGMTYGNVVGDLGDPVTLADGVKRATLTTIVNNITDRRMWFANVPELESLEDGQKLAVTPMYTVVASDQTSKLVGWDDTSASNNAVYMKLILANNVETDWVPCYFSPTARLTTHYGSGVPILFTYRENVFAGATNTAAGSTIMRAWYADVNYDTNTNTTFSKFNSAGIAGANGLKRYSLCMRDSAGLWTSIINQDNTVATTKTCYTGGLNPTSGVAYAAFNAVYAAGANSGDGMWESYGDVDLRYSLNIGTTVDTGLVQRTPLYLVGTIGSDGLFYLDQTKWWTQTPNDSTKVYIFISDCRADYYRAFLAVKNPLYIYDGTKLVEFDTSRIDELIDTVDNLTASDVGALPISGGTMTGVLTLKKDMYEDARNGALNMNNSDIYGLNSIYTCDKSDSPVEGIHFYRDATHVDTIHVNDGVVYLTPNRTLGTNGSSLAMLTESSNVKESHLIWGGKNFSGSYGPIDAAMIPELGANRLAFIKSSAVTTEYTRDGGETWIDYGTSGHDIFGAGGNYRIGKSDSSNMATQHYPDYQLRVTINTGTASVYTTLNKFAIYISTLDSTGCTVKIQKALQSTPDTYVDHTSDITITGWPRWNIINCSELTTYGNTASSQYGRVRFLFKASGASSGTTYLGLTVFRILGFGGMGHNTPSTMAKTGVLYSVDNNQNATFPASLKTTGGITIGNNTTSSIVNSGIQVNDVRNASLSPTIIDHAANLYFHSADGPTAEWWSILHVKGWEGGYSAWELAGPSHNVDQRTTPLYVRSSNVNSEWGSWRKIFDSAQTIPAANGGTGQTSLNDSANSLINSLTTGADVPKDADYYICQYVNGGTSTTTYHRRPTSKLYDYIVGKSKNLTAAGDLGWTTQDAGKMPLLVNGLAYWNGQYKSGSSNLEYCKKGAFGTAAIADLSTATNSTSTTTAATSSAVKTAYDLANTANGTANSALSGVNGSLIYDHTYTISNGVATFTAHVYLKGEEVTSTFADSCFTWSYKLADSVTGTPSIVSLGTGKTKTITISTLGYGGYVQGTFTPPSS